MVTTTRVLGTRRVALAALALAAAPFAIQPVLAADALKPVKVTFIQHCCSGATFFQPMQFGRRTWGQMALLGLTQTSLQYLFFYLGLAHTTGVKSSIMNATGTFFSVLLAHFIYKNDRLSYNKVLGCVVGVVVLFVPWHVVLEVDWGCLAPDCQPAAAAKVAKRRPGGRPRYSLAVSVS